VEISTGNLLLTALDHCAATYEKLGKLQAALRDSKQMIDLKPELAKVSIPESNVGLHADAFQGYLRCAKVLQLKGEHELALKIYERGLNKVKIGTDHDRTVGFFPEDHSPSHG
jgi:F-box/TPR repeat protein Pof3